MKLHRRKTVKWTLTLFAALTLVAWVGSCWWEISADLLWGATADFVAIGYGRIEIIVVDLLPPTPDGYKGLFLESNSLPDPHLYWWFEYENYHGWQKGRVFIPLWFPFLLLAAPAAWLWWRRDRRFPETACQSCGYDISGAPHERCPECGKEV